jgi:hypothetical protein
LISYSISQVVEVSWKCLLETLGQNRKRVDAQRKRRLENWLKHTHLPCLVHGKLTRVALDPLGKRK